MLMRPHLIDPAQPVALQQSALFVDGLRALRRDAEILPVGDCGQAAVIARRFGLFGQWRFTSRGPLWHPDAMPSDRVEALRLSRLDLINGEAEDDIVMQAAGYRMVMTPAHVASLPLLRDPAAQLAQAHVKWRNAARKLHRSGLRIARPRVTPVLLGWLLQAEAQQQRRKRYRALPSGLTEVMVNAQPEDALILTACRGNAVHAAILILCHGSAATYHLAWSDTDGRAASAHHGLLMAAADRLAQRGVTRLDLGSVDTVNAPGLARFKIGTGARIHPLGGTWLRLPGWRS